MRRGKSAELNDISPEMWAAAKARERVLRPLVRYGRRPEAAAIVEAAKQLGVSVQWTRSLLRRFISDPRTSVLLPDSGGRPRGLTILDARVDAVIAERIRTHYVPSAAWRRPAVQSAACGPQ